MRAHGYVVNPGSITALASRPCFAASVSCFTEVARFSLAYFGHALKGDVRSVRARKKEGSLDMTKAFALS